MKNLNQDKNHKLNSEVQDWSSPRKVRRVLRWCILALAVLGALEVGLLITGTLHHHEHFESIPQVSGLDTYPLFFAFYGFVSFMFMLWVARQFIGHVLQRREDYYLQVADSDPSATEAETIQK